jgi:drug/metabolite transporter (DMT)-like permease
MNYIVLAILTSTAIIVIFRVFERFKISVVQAITVNYLVASAFGFLSEIASFTFSEIPDKTWFLSSIIVGALLIISFNFFAYSAQYSGISITALSSRMSVVIPVSLGFLIFGDPVNIFKIAGIILALVAFYLTSKKEKAIKISTKYVWLPVLLFLAVGINDSMFKIAEHYFIGGDFVVFLATAFFVALILGMIVLLIKMLEKKEKFALKNVLAGIVLGLLNWFSTLYFLKGLDLFDVSVFVPLYNIGVVALSAVIGFLVFNEKLTKLNWVGIMLAIIAIFLITKF